MARRDEQKSKLNGSTNGKSRMKVFVAGFEMEGNDEVMAEGFKAIRELSTAISRNTVLPPALVSKPALGVSKSEATGVGTTTEAEEIEESVDGAEDTKTDEVIETTNSNGSGAKRSYTFKTPRFLDDLDVSKAKKNLNDFVAEKNPQDVMSKYLVTVYFLQKYMDIAEITADHIYTVFDTLGWKAEIPLKATKPLADLKSKRHVLTREAGAEGYKLNFKGEQEVERMGVTK